jgi:hypothetical protein
MIHNDYAVTGNREKLSALGYVVPGLESEVLLREIAEGNHDDGSEYLRHGRIKMKVLHEKLHENIVKVNAHQHQQQVAEQLYPSFQDGTGKNNEAVKKKAGGKTNHKRHQQGRDVPFHRDERRVHDLFVKNKMVGNEVKENIQQRIAPAACCVPKGLQRHDLPEGRIKEINKLKNPRSQHGRKFREGIPMIYVNKVVSQCFIKVITTYLFFITPLTCKKLRIGHAAFSFVLPYFCRS